MSENNPFQLSGSNIISPEQKVSQLSDPFLEESDSKFRASDELELETLEDEIQIEATNKTDQDPNFMRMTGSTNQNLSTVHEDQEGEDAPSCNLSRISKNEQTPSKGDQENYDNMRSDILSSVGRTEGQMRTMESQGVRKLGRTLSEEELQKAVIPKADEPEGGSCRTLLKKSRSKENMALGEEQIELDMHQKLPRGKKNNVPNVDRLINNKRLVNEADEEFLPNKEKKKLDSILDPNQKMERKLTPIGSITNDGQDNSN